MRTPPHTKWDPVFEILCSRVSISYPCSCDFPTAIRSALPATTAATSEASTTATEAATSGASAATTEVAATRSHAGGATIAVAAGVGSIESPGTASESIPVTCTTARKITTAYAIGSAGTETGAPAAIRATNGSCTVAETCIPRNVA
jgi:type IV secretory pathway TrbL component